MPESTKFTPVFKFRGMTYKVPFLSGEMPAKFKDHFIGRLYFAGLLQRELNNSGNLAL